MAVLGQVIGVDQEYIYFELLEEDESPENIEE